MTKTKTVWLFIIGGLIVVVACVIGALHWFMGSIGF